MSAPDIQPHESPIKTPKQLVVVVALAFVVPIIVIVLLATLATSGHYPDRDAPAMAPERVAERIKPVADVAVGGGLGGGAGGARAPKTGEEVYKSVCHTCHEAGVANAPRFGDRNAWAKLIREGQKALVQDAIKGKGAMPPKGGASDLSDAEIERAVVYMANAAGAKWKEPVVTEPAPAAKAAGAPAPAAAPAQTAAAPAQVPAPATAAKVDGKKVYDTTCSVCHAAGVANAPRLGDKAAWKPHLARGVNALYQTAIQGKGAMPPKGGNASLSEAEVRAAVDFMVGAVK